MNTTTAQRCRWPWILLGILTTLALIIALGILSFLRLNRDTRVLRDIALKTYGPAAHKNFEINVGRISTALVEKAVSWTAIDERIKTALQSVGSAEVGVYSIKRGADTAKLLAESQEAMNHLGWSPLVTVLENDGLVLVYIRERNHNPRAIEVCVLVQEDQQLIIASARGNLEPLWRLARNDPESPLKELKLALRNK